MSKERRTVSLDGDVENYLSSEGVNASQLVNKLVKNHATAGGDKKAMLEIREEQLLSDINELENRKETKVDELQRVREQLDGFKSEVDWVVEEAVEKLDDVPWEPTNPAIENWASKAEVSPDEFIDRLEDHEDDT